MGGEKEEDVVRSKIGPTSSDPIRNAQGKTHPSIAAKAVGRPRARGSIVGSTDSMVLHRPVELARILGKWEIDLQVVRPALFALIAAED